MPTTTFPVGGTGLNAGAIGVLYTTTTAVGTGADTDLTVLQSYTIPANAFSGNADLIRVKAWGTFAANANTKTVVAKFGGDEAGTITGAFNDCGWVYNMLLSGTATAQSAWVEAPVVDGNSGLVPATVIGLPTFTKDGTADIVLSITATNGTASANDIVCKGLLVEYLSSPA